MSVKFGKPTFEPLVHLLNARYPTMRVKWHDVDTLEVLSNSIPGLELEEGSMHTVSKLVKGADLNRLSDHISSISDEPSWVNFRLLSSREIYKLECISGRFDGSMLGLFISKGSDSSNSLDILETTAHDLRGPMNMIIGLVNLMQTMIRSENSESIKDELLNNLNLIKSSANNAVGFANDLMELAKLESPEFILTTEPISVNYFLREYISTHQLLVLRKKISMKLDTLVNDNAVVFIDKTKFTRVIDNLVINSVKFSEQNTTIRFNVDDGGGFVAITITDQGIGMSPQMIENLFVKFSASQRSGLEGEKSHGLGMSIVKQIMDLHFGKIEVNSQEGKGTQVTLLLRKSI